MEFKNQGIKCKTFWEAEAVIKKAEAKMKIAKTNKERRYFAQDVLSEVETLLSCADFIPGNPDCMSCHSISGRYIKEYKFLTKDESRKRVISR